MIITVYTQPSCIPHSVVDLSTAAQALEAVKAVGYPAARSTETAA